jgi:hypothetical protein
VATASTPLPAGNGARTAAPAMELPAPAPPRVERAAVQPARDDTTDEPGLPVFEAGGVAAAAVRRKAAAARQPQPPKSILPLLLILGGVGFAVLAAVALVVVAASLGWFSSASGPGKDEKQEKTRRVVVGPGELKPALLKAKPGDRLILQDTLHDDDVRVNTPNLTIEAEEGKTVVWRCRPNSIPNVKLLHVDGAANVTIRNITFDGGGRADACVLLYSNCPGVKLENVQFQNFALAGVYVTDCQGAEDLPITIEKCKFEVPANKTGVLFTVHRKPAKAGGTVPPVKYVAIRDCEFNGPGRKAATDGAQFVDSNTVELSGGKIEVVPNLIPNKK